MNGPRDDHIVTSIEDTLSAAAGNVPPDQVGQQAAPAPEAIASALMPSIELGSAPPPKPQGQRFAISVKEAPAKQFFMSLWRAHRSTWWCTPTAGGSTC